MIRHGYPAALAIALVSCGPSKEWVPPPVAFIPIPPGPATAEPAPVASTASSPAVVTTAAAKAAVPAAPPASPMPGDLPDVDTGLASSAACKDKECTVATMFPPSAASDAKGPVAIWSHDIAKGSAVTFPRDQDVDVYAVVVKGGGVLKKADGGADAPLKRWSAFRAPGGGVSVAAPDGPRARRLRDGHLRRRSDCGGRRKAPGEGHVEGLEDAHLGGRDGRPRRLEGPRVGRRSDARADRFRGDTQRASLGLLLASKDAAVPQHQHDGTWEVLAVLRGTGTLKHAKVAGSNDLASLSVTDGTVAMIPPGAQHAWQPKGDKPLVAIQLYAPPGPEQRFKKLAEGK